MGERLNSTWVNQSLCNLTTLPYITSIIPFVGFKALAEIPVHHETIQQVQTVGNIIDINDYPPDDFPPPPEEAERLIATLLPK